MGEESERIERKKKVVTCLWLENLREGKRYCYFFNTDQGNLWLAFNNQLSGVFKRYLNDKIWHFKFIPVSVQCQEQWFLGPQRKHIIQMPVPLVSR